MYRPTRIICPECSKDHLILRQSCLRHDFVCAGCRHTFDLADLFRLLSSRDFEILTALVENARSDRV